MFQHCKSKGKGTDATYFGKTLSFCELIYINSHKYKYDDILDKFAFQKCRSKIRFHIAGAFITFSDCLGWTDT